MDLTKIMASLTALTQWVRDGLTNKQSKVLVTSLTPSDSEGSDGDICMIIDA